MEQSVCEQSKNRPPLALTALPVQILERIVEYIYLQSALEVDVIKKKNDLPLKIRDILDCDKGTAGYKVEYKFYWDHEGPPILTTLQSLGAVNKQFHGLCCPWLWSNIRFPSTMPTAMSLWTDDILVKHGNFVKSIAFTLAERDFRLFNVNANSSVYDNLLLRAKAPSGSVHTSDFVVRRGLSLQSVEDVFVACPRTQSATLQFTLDHTTSTQSYDSICEGFAAAISRAPLQRSLVSLTLKDPKKTLSGQFVTSVIRELPCLVSLHCSGFNFAATDVEESLWWKLGQLTHLSQLRLSYVKCQDGTWNTKTWLERLRTLKIDHCEEMPPAKLHELLLSGFASHLTRLDFEGQASATGHDRDLTPCFLPALTQLSLRHDFRGCFIAGFTDCEDLEHLKYCCPTRKECGVLRELIALRTWPNLKILDLRHPKTWRTRDPGFELAQRRLANVCEGAKIEVRLGELDEEEEPRPVRDKW